MLRHCNSEEANHHHIFWACPVTHLFWKDIHQTLEAIFKINIPFQFHVLYLGILDLHETHYAYLWRIFLVAAKKAITHKWLQLDPPTPDELKAIVIET